MLVDSHYAATTLPVSVHSGKGLLTNGRPFKWTPPPFTGIWSVRCFQRFSPGDRPEMRPLSFREPRPPSPPTPPPAARSPARQRESTDRLKQAPFANLTGSR